MNISGDSEAGAQIVPRIEICWLRATPFGRDSSEDPAAAAQP